MFKWWDVVLLIHSNDSETRWWSFKLSRASPFQSGNCVNRLTFARWIIVAGIGVGGIYRVPRPTPWSSKILGLSVSNTKAHGDYLEQQHGNSDQGVSWPVQHGQCSVTVVYTDLCTGCQWITIVSQKNVNKMKRVRMWRFVQRVFLVISSTNPTNMGGIEALCQFQR